MLVRLPEAAIRTGKLQLGVIALISGRFSRLSEGVSGNLATCRLVVAASVDVARNGRWRVSWIVCWSGRSTLRLRAILDGC